MKKFMFFIICILILTGCEKLDLPRINPLDNLSKTTKIDETGEIVFNRFYSVYGSGIICKGEIYLLIYLGNNGADISKGVKATFSINSSYVSQLYPTTPINYGDISNDDFMGVGGITGMTPDYDMYTIRFKVSNSTPIPTSIVINIDITDENNNSWTDEFNITVASSGYN